MVGAAVEKRELGSRTTSGCGWVSAGCGGLCSEASAHEMVGRSTSGNETEEEVACMNRLREVEHAWRGTNQL